MFGPHASINVNGSFYVSTANYLKFADGAIFRAEQTPVPVLTSAAPEAFGFLGANPKPIVFEGSGSLLAEDVFGWKIAVPEGKTLAVVGGDISLRDGKLFGLIPVESRLKAPGGRFALISVASQGEVNPNANQINTDSFGRMGNITLESALPQGGQVNASGQGGGEIIIRGGNLTLKNASIVSGTTGSLDGKTIDINIRNDINISTNDAGIYSTSTSSGKGSNILLRSGNLMLSNHGLITTGTGATGDAGDLRIFAGKLNLSRSSITSTKRDDSSGAGGKIEINVRDINLNEASNIDSTVGKRSSNDGGVINVNADNMAINGVSSIRSNSSEKGTAQGGAITVDVKDKLVIEDGITVTSGGTRIPIPSGIFSNAFDGNGGNITITAKSLALNNIATLEAVANSSGNSGSIGVKAESLILSGAADINTSASGSGQGGNIKIETNRLDVQDSLIRTDTSGAGAGGNIVINARDFVNVKNFTFNKPSLISATTNSTNSNGGPAGDILITTPDLLMEGDSVIDARTLNDGGRAGHIRIDVERLRLANGAQIGSGSGIGNIQTGEVIPGTGDGGTVIINATESVLLSGESQLGIKSGVFSQTVGTGKGGLIKLITPNLTMLDMAQIGTDTGGNGNAGNIILQVNRLTMDNGSKISSDSGVPLAGRLLIGTGNAGTIEISSTQGLYMSGNGTVISTGTQGSGSGGDITINSREAKLTDASEIKANTLGTGRGGNINITTLDSLTLNNNAQISAKSEGLGNAGDIVVNAGNRLLSHSSSITAETKQADGGNININARNRTYLVDSAITTSVGGGNGKGGNINIDPQFVILDNSRIIANAFGGPGGNIQIVADHFIASPDSIISASSQFGVDGQVVINSPDTNMLGKIATLTAKFIDPSALFKAQCEARYNAGMSSLTVKVSKTVSPAPGEVYFMASPGPTINLPPAGVVKSTGPCPGPYPLQNNDLRSP